MERIMFRFGWMALWRAIVRLGSSGEIVRTRKKLINIMAIKVKANKKECANPMCEKDLTNAFSFKEIGVPRYYCGECWSSRLSCKS
ncbi:hypothetical protein ISS03_03900 [Patescibacteria group bacterium]|nr:hypothetical protein [Patescibacteria group bacterium]